MEVGEGLLGGAVDIISTEEPDLPLDNSYLFFVASALSNGRKVVKVCIDGACMYRRCIEAENLNIPLGMEAKVSGGSMCPSHFAFLFPFFFVNVTCGAS